MKKPIFAAFQIGFAQRFDELSAPLQNKVFTIMAKSPHLRGLALVDRVANKLTLDETIEAKRWLRTLSPEHKRLLAG